MIALAVAEECARDAALLGRFDLAERMLAAAGHIVEVKAAPAQPIACWSWVARDGYTVRAPYGWRAAALLGLAHHVPAAIADGFSIEAVEEWWAKRKGRAIA